LRSPALQARANASSTPRASAAGSASAGPASIIIISASTIHRFMGGPPSRDANIPSDPLDRQGEAVVDRRGPGVLDGDLVPVSRSGSGGLAGTDPGTQLFIAASLLILAGLAWAWTVAMAAMPECHHMGLPSFVLMWTVMMAAMMFPAVIPVVLAFTALARARRGHPALYCAGCCASLMVVLLVVGVMNVGWMVALSALIYLEKVLPAGGLVGRLAGVGLCAAGAARMLG